MRQEIGECPTSKNWYVTPAISSKYPRNSAQDLPHVAQRASNSMASTMQTTDNYHPLKDRPQQYDKITTIERRVKEINQSFQKLSAELQHKHAQSYVRLKNELASTSALVGSLRSYVDESIARSTPNYSLEDYFKVALQPDNLNAIADATANIWKCYKRHIWSR